jgi:hypothetical protein
LTGKVTGYALRNEVAGIGVMGGRMRGEEGEKGDGIKTDGGGGGG